MTTSPTEERPADPVASDPRAAHRLARVGLATAMISRLLGRLVGIVLVVVLARVAAPDTVAVYGYLLGTAALLITLTDLGVSAIAGREVAAGRMPADGALAAALLPQLASVALAALLTAVATRLLGPDGVPGSALALAVAYVVVGGVGNLWADLLRATGRVVLEGSLQLGTAVLLVAAGTTVILTGGNATDLLVVVLLKEILALSVMVFVLRPRRRPEARPRALLGHGVWVAVASTAIVLLWRQGTLVVGNVAGLSTLAVYVVATRYFDAGVTVAHTAGFGLGPGMAQLAGHPAEFRRAALRYLGLAAGAGVVVATVGALLAGPLTTVPFGEQWASAVPAVRVIAVSTPAILLAYVLFTLLMARGQMRLLTLASVVGAVTGVAGTVVLVRMWSDAAAGVAGTAAGAVVMVLVCAWGLRDLVHRPAA